MDEQDNTATQQSVTEHQLRRLVVPALAAYDPSRRIDVIHEPDLEVVWGGPE